MRQSRTFGYLVGMALLGLSNAALAETVTVNSATPILLGEPARPARTAAPPATPPPVLKPAINESPARVRSIQLGAWRREDQAKAAWSEALRRAGGLLGGLTPVILSDDLPGKGHYFRLRIRQPNTDAATEFCADLKSKGLACFLVPD